MHAAAPVSGNRSWVAGLPKFQNGWETMQIKEFWSNMSNFFEKPRNLAQNPPYISIST